MMLHRWALVLLVQLMHADASDYPDNSFGRMEGEVVSLTDAQDNDACEEYYGPNRSYPTQTIIYEDTSESSSALPKSSSLVCHGGAEDLNTICHARHLTVVPAKLKLPAEGNEMVHRVEGQGEDAEFAVPEPGALLLGGTLDEIHPIQLLSKYPRPLQEVFDSIKVVDKHDLPMNSIMHMQPTVLVVRMEYVNLWHEANDWFLAYMACRLLGWNPRTVDVVWLDAHPRGMLDGAWRSLFHSGRHFGDRLAPGQPVVFATAALLPTNYHSSLTAAFRHPTAGYPSLSCPRPYTHIEAFHDLLVSSYGLVPKGATGAKMAATAPGVEVVVILRTSSKDLAHPRAKRGGHVRGETTLRHVSELKHAAEMNAQLKSLQAVKVVPGDFANMRVKNQLQLVRSADVLAGAHGAGLTWILAMNADALGVLEWGPSQGQHFRVLAALRRLPYLYRGEFDAAELARMLASLVNTHGTTD
jgi:hypothetical protein